VCKTYHPRAAPVSASVSQLANSKRRSPRHTVLLRIAQVQIALCDPLFVQSVTPVGSPPVRVTYTFYTLIVPHVLTRFSRRTIPGEGLLQAARCRETGCEIRCNEGEFVEVRLCTARLQLDAGWVPVHLREFSDGPSIARGDLLSATDPTQSDDRQRTDS
jgi:hypothetical protein